MNDVAFAEPVILRLPGIGQRKVANSFEAMECLDKEWPDWARGRSWRSAFRACRDALDGWRSANQARRIFRKAASRAGILQPGRRNDRERSRYPATDFPATASVQ